MVQTRSGRTNTNDLSQLRATYEMFKSGDIEFKGENVIDKNGNIYNTTVSDPSNTIEESQESEFYEDTLGSNPKSPSPPIQKPILENNFTKQNINKNDFSEPPQIKRSKPDNQPVLENSSIARAPVQLPIPRDNIQIESQECDMDMESDDEFTPAPALNHLPSRPIAHTNLPEPLKENKSTGNIANQGPKPSKYVLALLNKQQNNAQSAADRRSSATNTNTRTVLNETSANAPIPAPEPVRSHISGSESMGVHFPSSDPTRTHISQPESTRAPLSLHGPTRAHLSQPEPIRAHMPQPESTRSSVLQRELTEVNSPQPEPTIATSLPVESTRTQLPPAAPIRANLVPPEPTRAYVSPPEPVRTNTPTNLASTSHAPLTNHPHIPITNGNASVSAQIDLPSLLQTTQNSSQPIHANNSSTSTIQSLFNAAPQIPGVPTMLNQNGQMRVIFLPFIDLDRLNINSNNPNQQ